MGFLRYVKAAFNARPWSMWIPPNWVGLATFGLLGTQNSGFWLLGAGLEMGYLVWLASSRRFQKVVDGKDVQAHNKDSEKQITSWLGSLRDADQDRYRQLQNRCQGVLQQQRDVLPADLQTQADGLGKLLYLYLRLLLTRNGILRALEGASTKSIDLRISEVKAHLNTAAAPELQKSLQDQVEILSERKQRHVEAKHKMEFIDAELTRIQEQVELIREGLAVTSDPQSLSRRIDTIGDSLGSTTQWIKQQQELFGSTEDSLGDPPPVVLEVPRQ